MSFDFNLSSSDEEEQDGNFFGASVGHGSIAPTVTATASTNDDGSDNDDTSVEENDFDGYDDYYDFDEQDDRKPSSLDSSSVEAMAFPSDFDVKATHGSDDEEENEDEDEIDWEDAEDETQEGIGEASSTKQHTIATPKAVTLNLGERPTKDTDTDTAKRKRSKRTQSVSVFRHDKLEGNPELQFLLTELHKSSLLAWASHAHAFSAYASRETSLGLAHSLISTAWLWKEDPHQDSSSPTSVPSTVVIPTQDDIGHFVRWFRASIGSSGSSSHTNGKLGARGSVTRTGKRVRNSSSESSRSSNRNLRRNKTSPKHNKTSNHNTGGLGISGVPSCGFFGTYQLTDYCAHLSDLQRNHHHPTERRESRAVFYDSDSLLLFLSMIRSLGWRARYVVAMEPISRDLDVDHPLFHSDTYANPTQNVLKRFFGRVAAFSTSNGKKETPIAIDDDDEEEDSKPPAKNISSEKCPPKFPTSLYSNDARHGTAMEAPRQHVCWVEVLCRTTATKKGRQRAAAVAAPAASKSTPPTMQWVHVDPILGITNQPSIVEEIIFDRAMERTKSSGGKRKRTINGRNKRPISYALAVEHYQRQGPNDKPNHSNEDPLEVRMTDVTRRYASSMVETMQARGIAQQKPSNKPKKRKLWRARMTGDFTAIGANTTRGDRPDQWFSRFLKLINQRNTHGSNQAKSRTKSSSSKARREVLKSKGKSKEDAIALDDGDESDLDRKPAAIDHKDDIDHEEESQLKALAKKEPLPTSKAAFKKHPLYAIPSVLTSTEVLTPDAKKHVCGMFKGELVYRRQDVETALSAKRWLYEGRKVKESERNQPVKKVKARKPPTPKGFRALKSYGVGASNDGSEASRQQQIQEASAPLGDGKESLYGSWQTDPWGPPPVSPNDPIPINEHHNVELELLNPGLVHVELYRVAKVAKQLGLPYAPCLLGFEGSGRPTIRGIVVHETNEELLREAHAGMAEHLRQEEEEKRERAILLRWKRLLVGVLTKDRLEREYGDADESEEHQAETE